MSAAKVKVVRGTGEDAARVVQALRRFCDNLRPGDQVPTHTELMRQLHSSERFVRRALDELVREGRIVRRSGVGTFIADATPTPASSRTVVALARPDRAFFDRFMAVLFWQAEDAGLELVCQPLESFEDNPAIAQAMSQPPLGYVLFGYDLMRLGERLRSLGARVVMVGAPPAGEDPAIPCVANDNTTGGYLATRHLIELGHRRIVFDPGTGSNTMPRHWQHHRRWQGHLKALEEAAADGIRIPAELLLPEEVRRWAQDPEQVRAYFAMPGAPTAIVAWNDHEAAQILASLSRAGIQVPGDVSLVGHDALPEGQIVYPSLTTVDHDIERQAEVAMRYLAGQTDLVFELSCPRLVIRESTSGPPSSRNSS